MWTTLTQAGRFLGAPPAADAQVYWYMARSAGVLAYLLSFYLTALLVVSFYVKKRIGHQVWRWLHYASFLGWVMVTFHGLLAGSDRGTLVMLALYVMATLSVFLLTAYRILAAKARKAHATA